MNPNNISSTAFQGGGGGGGANNNNSNTIPNNLMDFKAKLNALPHPSATTFAGFHDPSEYPMHMEIPPGTVARPICDVAVDVQHTAAAFAARASASTNAAGGGAGAAEQQVPTNSVAVFAPPPQPQHTAPAVAAPVVPPPAAPRTLFQPQQHQPGTPTALISGTTNLVAPMVVAPPPPPPQAAANNNIPSHTTIINNATTTTAPFTPELNIMNSSGVNNSATTALHSGGGGGGAPSVGSVSSNNTSAAAAAAGGTNANANAASPKALQNLKKRLRLLKEQQAVLNEERQSILDDMDLWDDEDEQAIAGESIEERMAKIDTKRKENEARIRDIQAKLSAYMLQEGNDAIGNPAVGGVLTPNFSGNQSVPPPAATAGGVGQVSPGAFGHQQQQGQFNNVVGGTSIAAPVCGTTAMSGPAPIPPPQPVQQQQQPSGFAGEFTGLGQASSGGFAQQQQQQQSMTFIDPLRNSGSGGNNFSSGGGGNGSGMFDQLAAISSASNIPHAAGAPSNQQPMTFIDPLRQNGGGFNDNFGFGGGGGGNGSGSGTFQGRPGDLKWEQMEADALDTTNRIQGNVEDMEQNPLSEWQHTRFPWSEAAQFALTTTFNKRNFRLRQLEVVNAVMAERDVFVLLPTGGGKSLCYQLPATLPNPMQVTFIFSPLVSLIQDQLMALTSLDILSAALTGTTQEDVKRAIFGEWRSGKIHTCLVYSTPEFFGKSDMLVNALVDLNKKGLLARFVIDEAHCVSSWGHDFRPDYQKLSVLKKFFPNVPVTALTATATVKVLNDVISTLSIPKAIVFKGSFNRSNLKYSCQKVGKAASKTVAEIIRARFKNASGIVYCLSKKDCEEMAQDLRREGISADYYHADAPNKNSRQDNWSHDRTKVICATIAFGMGIDKADVRFVIHAAMPKSIEGYYQESGRAGRDGLPSECILLYCGSDKQRLDRLIISGRDQQTSITNLQNMVSFTLNNVECRRQLQLRYFSEEVPDAFCLSQPHMQHCDNCASRKKDCWNPKQVDVTAHAICLCRILKSMGSMTSKQCVAVYRGTSDVGVTNERKLKSGHAPKEYKQGDKVNKELCERVMLELGIKGIVNETLKEMRQSVVAYVQLGGRNAGLYHQMEAGQYKITVLDREFDRAAKLQAAKKTKNSLDAITGAAPAVEESSSSDDDSDENLTLQEFAAKNNATEKKKKASGTSQDSAKKKLARKLLFEELKAYASQYGQQTLPVKYPRMTMSIFWGEKNISDLADKIKKVSAASSASKFDPTNVESFYPFFEALAWVELSFYTIKVFRRVCRDTLQDPRWKGKKDDELVLPEEVEECCQPKKNLGKAAPGYQASKKPPPPAGSSDAPVVVNSETPVRSLPAHGQGLGGVGVGSTTSIPSVSQPSAPKVSQPQRTLFVPSSSATSGGGGGPAPLPPAKGPAPLPVFKSAPQPVGGGAPQTTTVLPPPAPAPAPQHHAPPPVAITPPQLTVAPVAAANNPVNNNNAAPVSGGAMFLQNYNRQKSTNQQQQVVHEVVDLTSPEPTRQYPAPPPPPAAVPPVAVPSHQAPHVPMHATGGGGGVSAPPPQQQQPPVQPPAVAAVSPQQKKFIIDAATAKAIRDDFNSKETMDLFAMMDDAANNTPAARYSSGSGGVGDKRPSTSTHRHNRGGGAPPDPSEDQNPDKRPRME